MNSNFWPTNYIDSLGQKCRQGYTIEDAWCFLQMHSEILTGKIAMVYVGVGSVPDGDRAVQGNNEYLSDLPSPFIASFIPQTGGGADDDGFLLWNEPIQMTIHPRPNMNKVITVKSKFLPLEVGYTEFSKTLVHMRTGGVARWPYGQKDITVFYRTAPCPAGIHLSVKQAYLENKTANDQLQIDN